MEMNIETEQMGQEQHASIDVERQHKAREYARIKRRLSLVGLAIATVSIGIVLVSGLDKWLRNVLQPLAWQPVHGWFPLQILAYFVILVVVYQLITAPLAYYSGFILPHRYGLSTMSIQVWLLDLLKGFGLGLILEICVIELIYALLAFQPHTWCLCVAILILFF